MSKEILAIIPARGGSKGIPGKNLIDLCGRPLIEYTIDAAKGSSFITRIILSTDSEAIAEVCRAAGVEVPFMRPLELSGDEVPMIDVVLHALKFLEEKDGYRPDYVVLLQPTSPLRRSVHIDEAINIMSGSNADTVVSVVPVPHNFNPYSVMKESGGCLEQFLEHDERMNSRQVKPVLWGRNGPAVLAFKAEVFKRTGKFYSGRVVPCRMKENESIDVDIADDLELAEYLLNRRDI